MKKIAIALLFLFSTFAWAAADTNPAEYTVSVHVSTSRMVLGNSLADVQTLNVVIEGKKYELRSDSRPNALLALGDYKAKIVREEVTSSPRAVMG